MKVRNNAFVRSLPDYCPQAPQASSAVRGVDFKVPVGIDGQCGHFSFFISPLVGGNESGVGGDQKFDRVESTTETRAARCSFPSHATPHDFEKDTFYSCRRVDCYGH